LGLRGAWVVGMVQVRSWWSGAGSRFAEEKSRVLQLFFLFLFLFIFLFLFLFLFCFILFYAISLRSSGEVVSRVRHWWKGGAVFHVWGGLRVPFYGEDGG